MIYVKSFLPLKERIVHEKDAFLLIYLLEVLKRLSELSGFREPIFSNTRTLKIIDKFSDDNSFYLNGKYLIARSSDVNTYEHTPAIMKGWELKHYDIIKSFGEMIRRKIK